MTHDTVTLETVEEARNFVSGGGKWLVLDAETLQQMEDAEAAGGFEGGSTGNADGAPFSAPATGGEDFSSQSDPAPVEEIDLEGAWRLKKTMTIDDAVEHVMDLRDVVETWLGEMTGPVLLVPKKELDRWLGRSDPADGA